METLNNLQTDLLANRFVQALLIALISFVAAKIFDWLLSRTILQLTKKTKSIIDDEIVANFHGPVIKTIVIIGLSIATHRMALEEQITVFTIKSLQTIALVIWVVFTLRVSTLLLGSASRQTTRFQIIDDRTFPLFSNLAKLLIVGIAMYILILAWGVDATGWIASAGIIGLAVSFAAKDTLSNLFAGVFIIADAPYKIGDFIVLDSGERGRVINIGLRSTRILTLDDIELTVPNAIMGNAKITNESAGPYPKRRVRVAVGVAYGTDVDKVRQILLEVADGEEEVCQEPAARVRFRSFGDSGLNFDLLCWIDEPALQGKVIDALNTAVYKRFAAEGIEIPYPKRDLYIREMPGKTQNEKE
jgi:small-conductance mechanosensitive channel